MTLSLSKLITVCHSSKVYSNFCRIKEGKKKEKTLYPYSCSVSGSVHSDKGEKRYNIEKSNLLFYLILSAD